MVRGVRRRFGLVLAVLAVLAPAAAGCAAPPDAASVGTLTVVTTSPIESMTYAPEMVAVARGDFARHGVAVDLQALHVSPAALQAVLSGSAQLTRLGDIETMIAVGGRGAPAAGRRHRDRDRHAADRLWAIGCAQVVNSVMHSAFGDYAAKTIGWAQSRVHLGARGDDVARAHLLARLRHQVATTGAPDLRELHDELCTYPAPPAEPPPHAAPVVPIRLARLAATPARPVRGRPITA